MITTEERQRIGRIEEQQFRMLLVVIGFVALAFWGAVAVGLVTFVRMVIRGVGG